MATTPSNIIHKQQTPQPQTRTYNLPRLIPVTDAHEASITRSINNTSGWSTGTLVIPNAAEISPAVLPGQGGSLNTPVPPVTELPLVIHATTKRQPADTPVPATKLRVVI